MRLVHPERWGHLEFRCTEGIVVPSPPRSYLGQVPITVRLGRPARVKGGRYELSHVQTLDPRKLRRLGR